MAGDMGEDIFVRPHSEGLWNTEAAQTTNSGMICSMAWHAGMQNLHCRNNIGLMRLGPVEGGGRPYSSLSTTRLWVTGVGWGGIEQENYQETEAIKKHKKITKAGQWPSSEIPKFQVGCICYLTT